MDGAHDRVDAGQVAAVFAVGGVVFDEARLDRQRVLCGFLGVGPALQVQVGAGVLGVGEGEVVLGFGVVGVGGGERAQDR